MPRRVLVATGVTWHSLPVFVRLHGRPVILVGEGEVAEAKRRLLERAGAAVVADHPDARLAIVAVEDEAEATAAVAALRQRGLLVNAVDRPALCDFTLPAIVDRSPVLVAVGTGGVSAGLAAALRQRLEGGLSPKLGELATLLGQARTDLRRVFPDSGRRRRAIAAALAPGGVLDLNDPDVNYPLWIEEVGRDMDDAVELLRLASSDPDDLTLRQARALANADLVLHDGRVPYSILDRARADAPRLLSPEPPLAVGRGLTVWIGMA